MPAVVESAPKPFASGAYKDNAGTVHQWQIETGHILQWDGVPYLPVGGKFEPKYWADGQTDANWAADAAALQSLKKNGIQDIYLTVSTGLPNVPPQAVQRMIDYLDQNGFRYGLEIGDHPKEPLVGYVIKPAVYRALATGNSSAIKFGDMNGLQSALYAVASTSDADDDTVNINDAVTDDTTALIPVSASNSFDSVVLLYPQRAFDSSTPEGHLPDLWQGYDDYRDRVLAFFSHIHLGKGFRFFIDPLCDSIGMNGDVSDLVPSSDGFHIEFQAWLEQQYKTPDDLNRAWGIKQRDIPDFATAARCIPLWNDLRGIPSIYDPVKHVGYGVVNKPTIQGRYWDDLNDFKTKSVRDYMNGMADVLKAAVADVPVVFKALSENKLFVNDKTVGGFDGLAIEALGHGTEVQTKSAAPVFAMAEESSTSGWIIVSDTAAPVASGNAGDAAVKTMLTKDWNDLRDAGVRGIYVSGLANSTMDEAAWVGAYGADFARSEGALMAQDNPVLWYPAWAVRENPGVRRLTDGVWWLPSYQTGHVIPLGSKLRAYALDDPSGGLPTYVLWSPHNEMNVVSFTYDKNVHPVVTDPAGTLIKVKDKGGVIQVPVGDEPILISHVRDLPLPLELVDAAQDEVSKLISTADAKKVPIDQYKNEFMYARDSPAVNDVDVQAKFTRFERLIAALGSMLRPYAWIEGESASPSTFDSIVASSDASGGVYLSLDNDKQPPTLDTGTGRGYTATYNFTVNAAGRYAIWLAGSKLDPMEVSPFTYEVDGEQPVDVRDLPAEGDPYGPFFWTNIGEATIDSPGKHTLTISVTEPRPDGRYKLAVDALCVTSVVFHPNGLTPPEIDAPSIAPAPSTPSKEAGQDNTLTGDVRDLDIPDQQQPAAKHK